MRVREITGKEKLGKEEIFKKAKREGGILTAYGCGYLWKHCRASADSDNGFQAALIDKERKQLRNASIRIGETFPEVVWAVMENWVAFAKHAESTTEAFNIPTLPNIAFFTKFVESAADFTQSNQNSGDSGFMQVIAKPIEPLTKPIETGDNIDPPITIEELRAIGKDLFG